MFAGEQILTTDQQRHHHWRCLMRHTWRWIYQRELWLALREAWRALRTLFEA